MLKYILLAALSGFFLPLQSLINARTSEVMNGPMMAAFVNFTSGTIALLILLPLIRMPIPTAAQIAQVPPYGWITGVFGILFVAQAAFTIPKLGAAAMIALVVAGQMFGSIVFDHFGVLQQVQPVSWEKIIGSMLLLFGVYLILKPV